MDDKEYETVTVVRTPNTRFPSPPRPISPMRKRRGVRYLPGFWQSNAVSRPRVWVYANMLADTDPGEPDRRELRLVELDWPAGGPNLQASEIAPAVDCGRCGMALPLRPED